MDLTKAEDVVMYMLETVNSNDWNKRCDAVKQANKNANGYPDYPSFWFKEILQSGLAYTVLNQFTEQRVK